MSFAFEWPQFSDEFYANARDLLDNALNKGNKPPIIADRIEVVEIEMGTQPPELEIRDIGEITTEQFRGIFRMRYAGDAHIVLRTKVQANPLTHKKPDIHIMSGSRGMLAANQPLVVPMLLRLSRFKLDSYVVLVVSKHKGVTLVFKTDPLQNVDVNSTFDSIAVIQKYIQRQIEEQLREMFREDLPSIIHRLSQSWLATRSKVEAPYLGNKPQHLETRSNPDVSGRRILPAALDMSASVPTLPPRTNLSASLSFVPPKISRPASSVGTSISRRNSQSTTRTQSEPEPPTFPGIDDYDPTYGMRPEGLPPRSDFGGFKRLWGADRGLADLREESVAEDDMNSFIANDWEDIASTYEPPSDGSSPAGELQEIETIPAVGGGFVIRPRQYHAHARSGSQVDLSSRKTVRALSPSIPLTSAHISTVSISSVPFNSQSSEFTDISTSSVDSPSAGPVESSARPVIRHPIYADPVPVFAATRARRYSISSPHRATPPPSESHTSPSRSSRPLSPAFGERAIVLPSERAGHLRTLARLSQTLSPYAPALEHVTVRSVPRRAVLAPAPEPRARRKRLFHFGGGDHPPPLSELAKDVPPLDDAPQRGMSTSPTPPSPFDASERDYYFQPPPPAMYLRQRTARPPHSSLP